MKAEVIKILKGSRVIVKDGVGRKSILYTDRSLTVGDTVLVISGVIVSKSSSSKDVIINV